ncbi:MAG: DUF6629 family protein [Gemmataceae bacterium]
MCFSATASFAVSAALAPAGAYCLWRAARVNLRLIPFAALPLFFGAQQLCEGLVWHGLDHGDAELTRDASLAYLFFAVPFWPFWVPFSLFWAETRSRVRAFLLLMTSVALAYLWLYAQIVAAPAQWLTTEVLGHSIHYEFGSLPAFAVIPQAAWRIVYLVLICIPFLATRPGGVSARAAAVLVAAAFVVAYLFFWATFISVWCFFAAALSILLCRHFALLPRAEKDSSDLRRGTDASQRC